MIRFSNLSLIRGTKPLLEGTDLLLNPGERVGLFALLRGELHADKGDAEFPATWRVAHVAQETPALERAALEYAIDGDGTLRALEAELAAAEHANDGARMGELYAALADADWYT